MTATVTPLDPPNPIKKRLSPREILDGKPIEKIDRLRVMSEDDFEDFVHEWAWGHLKTTYTEVKKIGGAGDKGRDILGYYADGKFDLYQCKHYKSAISPSQIYVEFGKLCYYTYSREYDIPNKFYLVSPHGPGPDLSDLLTNPKSINKKLVENWDKYCLKSISTTQIPLADKLLAYVEAFDFSIVAAKDTLTLIGEHANTIFHAARFGGGIRKYREIIPEPSDEIQAKELTYVLELYKVYSEKLGENISDKKRLKELNDQLFNHFHEQRKGFFSAEALEIFSRENFPGYDPSPYDQFKNDAYSIISNLLLLLENEPGLKKLLSAIQEILRSDFSSNPLTMAYEVMALDRTGVCHHLVNENRIKWLA